MRWLVVLGLAACGRIGFGEEAHDAEPPIVDRCDPRIDATTIALYSFETGVTIDTTTQHDAAIVGFVPTTPGPCITGASFDGASHLLVPDSPAFDVPEGSVELFARVTATGSEQGFLSRDALGQDFDGHLSIGVAASGQLFVRLQRITSSVYRCTETAIPTDQWFHVGTSFGPQGFQAWLDGVPLTGTTASLFGAPQICTEPHTFGIDGNDNAMVIGALNVQGANGAPAPMIVSPLTGAIDQIRIRKAWRDFGN